MVGEQDFYTLSAIFFKYFICSFFQNIVTTVETSTGIAKRKIQNSKGKVSKTKKKVKFYE